MSARPTSRFYESPFSDNFRESNAGQTVPFGRGRPEPDHETVSTPATPRPDENRHGQPSPGKRKVVVIYDKLLLAECLKTALQASLAMDVEVCSSIERVRDGDPDIQSGLVLIFIDTVRKPETFDLLRQTTAAAPGAAVVVLSLSREYRLVREVMECGARAYIPMTMGFAVAIEAVKFVLAGGTYVPPESLVETGPPLHFLQRPDAASPVTVREMSIIQAIQQGKSNKIIAYELSLCESTVKVHIRNIMRKLRAKNRTEVAVRSAEFGAAPILGRTG